MGVRACCFWMFLGKIWSLGGLGRHTYVGLVYVYRSVIKTLSHYIKQFDKKPLGASLSDEKLFLFFILCVWILEFFLFPNTNFFF